MKKSNNTFKVLFVGLIGAMLSLALSMLMGSTASAVVASFNYELNPVNCGVGIFAAYSTAMIFGALPSFPFAGAIQQELWVNYIIENLFKDNTFADKCFNEDDKVLAGSVVHIPNAGAAPTVVKNRSSFPATAVRRTDTDTTYTLDVFTTDPTLITNAEANEISYDKMSNVLDEHVSGLGESVADELLYKWSPTVAGQIIRTTGGDVTSHPNATATGNRKKFLKEDLKSAALLMNKNNIPKADRFAVIPSDLYNELLEDSTLMGRDGVAGGEINVKDGVILKLYGFNIIERSATTVYSNATPPAPKAPGAAAATTDNYAVICWQKNAVAKAKGSVKFFENTDDALHYGDVYSAELKAGGRIRRTAGVVAIVQAAGS